MEDIENYKKIAVFDLECISEDNIFPQAKRANDSIIMIATTFYIANQIITSVITTEPCESIQNIMVEVCKTERDVILAWCALIQRMNTNICKYSEFNFEYLTQRCEKIGIDDSLSKLKLVATMN